MLRALQEAGVRIDIVAGHGIGAVTALLAAIDGGAKLWDDGGLWRSPRVSAYYRWRWPFRTAAYLMVLLAAVFAIPAIVIGLSAAAYAVGFLLALVGVGSGTVLVAWVSAQTANAFAGPGLPTVVPRLVMLVVMMIGAMLAFAMMARPAMGMARAARGRWWWRLVSSPLDVAPLRTAAFRSAWDLVRGAATSTRPSPAVLSRRYAEVLAENMGQPGCRELMLAVTDLDARRDIVGALLSSEHQDEFFASQPGRERGAEVVDLAGPGRDIVIDLLGAALAPAIGAEAHPVAFPMDGYWAGETHRACDRPGILGRLLAELDLAKVTQVIVVSAAAPTAVPHRLGTPPSEPRARLGEFCVAAEAASLDTAVRAAREHFDAVFTVCPAHNPVGPFDFGGAYDEGSDRRRALADLLQQGYHDAYHQFIDPIVGASGEHLTRPLTEP